MYFLNLFKNSENKVNHRQNRWNMSVYFSLDGKDILQQLLNIFAEVHNMIIWSAHSCVQSIYLIAGEAIFCSLSRLSSFFFSSSSDCWFLCNNSSIFRLSNLETYSSENHVGSGRLDSIIHSFTTLDIQTIIDIHTQNNPMSAQW